MSRSSRRHFLAKNAFGISSLGLASLMQSENLMGAPKKPAFEKAIHDMLSKSPLAAPKANAMISIFAGGGPSHIDLFDPKPELKKWDGKPIPPRDIKYDNAGQASAIVMASPWEFERCGESGMELNTTLLPELGGIADDITLIRSMQLPGIRNHGAGMRALTSGRGLAGHPSLGSWITYGLGAESQNLPAFVAIVLRKNPPGSPYWDSRHLPSIYQGTIMRETAPRIANLRPPQHLQGAAQKNQLELLKSLNQKHLASRPGEDDLAARISSYELAAKMQTEASDALDLKKETEATKKLYGLDNDDTKQMGEACLLARRLVERGVRFVQIWDYAWDMHQQLVENLPIRCNGVDKPSAGLVKDLKSRGLLDSTIVQWGGEMGRLPVVQNRGNGLTPGRDHNTEGFSIWMAGGGIKRGHIHGSTDEFGHRAVDGIVNQHDFHTTLLHQFGLDPDSLIYESGGEKIALVEKGQGKVVDGILA